MSSHRLKLRTVLLAVWFSSTSWLVACSEPQQDIKSAETIAAPTPELIHEAFTEARFQELSQGDGLVLVDVSASWCPTCRHQKRVLAKFQQQHPGVPLTVLSVDYDTQKEWVTHFKAPRQSTLALYQNGTQVWFAVAEQREDAIFEALLKAAGHAT